MLKVIGGEQEGEFKAIASGALPNGKPVVVNSDGTVSVVDANANPAGAGAPVVFEAANIGQSSAAFDSSANKIVIAYRLSTAVCEAVVGTVSGKSISFGTAVQFSSSSTLFKESVVFDSNSNKVVISFKDNSNLAYGTSIVGTVSGTSISFGSKVVFESAVVNDIGSTFDSSNNKIVIAYSDDANNDYGTAVVGTVSGTSISFGSASVFETVQTTQISCTFDSNENKAVIAYRDQGSARYGNVKVATVSGTSISFGSKVVFEPANTAGMSCTFDSNSNKVVIAYRDYGNNIHGTAIVGTVSGTSISFGTAVVFEAASTNFISASFDSTFNKIVIAYTDTDNSSNGTAIVGTVSGTSISFDTAIVFEAASTGGFSSAFDLNEKKSVFSYYDAGNSSYGTAVVFQSVSASNLTSENYIGTAASGAPDGTGVGVNIIGAVDKNQSALTTGEKYYVQSDGTLSTTADDPSVLAGTAISATDLVVKT